MYNVLYVYVSYYEHCYNVVCIRSELELTQDSTIIRLYCEIILYRGHEISWFNYDGHVRGHLNSWIFKSNTQLTYWIKSTFRWDLKFVDSHTHEFKCPTNKNEFTVLQQSVHLTSGPGFTSNKPHYFVSDSLPFNMGFLGHLSDIDMSNIINRIYFY